MRLYLILAIGSLLVGCGTTSSVNMTTGELRTQPSLVSLHENRETSAETVAGAVVVGAAANYAGNTMGVPLLGTVQPIHAGMAGVLFYIYDPLAPNWTIKEQMLAPDTYLLSMTAKSFRRGGDGEAIQIVKRRALQLQRDKGYADYRILDYTEGIESSTPFTHRVSQGTIQLVKAKIPERR